MTRICVGNNQSIPSMVKDGKTSSVILFEFPGIDGACSGPPYRRYVLSATVGSGGTKLLEDPVRFSRNDEEVRCIWFRRHADQLIVNKMRLWCYYALSALIRNHPVQPSFYICRR